MQISFALNYVINARRIVVFLGGRFFRCVDYCKLLLDVKIRQTVCILTANWLYFPQTVVQKRKVWYNVYNGKYEQFLFCLQATKTTKYCIP